MIFISSSGSGIIELKPVSPGLKVTASEPDKLVMGLTGTGWLGGSKVNRNNRNLFFPRQAESTG
jgi:hypothetical protein